MSSSSPKPKSVRSPQRDSFISRVAVVSAAVALLYLAWVIRHALILVFAGIVAAVIIQSVADPLRRVTGVSRRLAAGLGMLAIVLVIVVFGWLAMPAVQSQARELLSLLPESVQELEDRLGSLLPEGAISSGGIMSTIAERLATWSTAVVSAIVTLVLLVAAGVFLAIRPADYRDGLVALVAPSQQRRLREALNHTGTALKGWLRAQILSMLLVGVCVAGATWALSLPSPFALGFIAALLEFVPIIGPIAAALPALLLALTVSPMMMVWTGLTYFAIEQVESNIILPLAQQEVAHLPPVLLIFAFVAFGAIFGFAGILVSAPLSIALYTLVDDLYVKPLNEG